MRDVNPNTPPQEAPKHDLAGKKLLGYAAQTPDHVINAIEHLVRTKSTPMTDKDVEFVEWFLKHNPNLFEHTKGEVFNFNRNSRSIGRYTQAKHLIGLAANYADAPTIVHELLHSTERMMSPAAQGAVRDAWKRAVNAALKKTTTKEVRDFLNKARASDGVREYNADKELDVVNAYKAIPKDTPGGTEQ
jgi:hypothetical protein